MNPALPLRTDRLVLRNFVTPDEEAVHAFAGDPVVTRFTEWGPNSRDDTRRFVRDYAAQATAPRRAAYNLAAVADGELVGSVALWVEDAGHRRGGLGFVFHPAVWGRGYATEAARELVRFGFGELGLHRIAATCHPDNLGSARVLTRAGLREEGRMRDHLLVRGAWRDSLLFAALAPATSAV
ncbi:GNAT family N-acetyltransferase [Actinoplanes sp. HUAS TT8]|uniref:GNAT family N-acetyltransferase n=1 Tax=Actinoplanes sp. HUAS TT8 TaxID=3447453 RepID=UPI003F51B0E9